MRSRIGLKWSASRKALLAVAALAALAVPITNAGVTPAASRVQPQPQDSPEFEVAAIRPNDTSTRIDPRLTATGCRGTDTRPDRRPDRPQVPLGRCIFVRSTVAGLIGMAYIGEEAVTGGPDWVRSERFDIEAKAPNTSKATGKDLYQMLQNLLSKRFKLKVRWESKEISGYGLVLAKNGHRLAAAKNTGVRPSVSARPGPGVVTLIGQNASMRNLAGSLSLFGIGSVADKTELADAYDFELTFAMEPGMESPKKTGTAQILPGSGPSLFTAIEEQLGLRLTPQKLNVEYLVIESVERPSAN
jgi:uncharacterized protein (TIGR03435 family)